MITPLQLEITKLIGKKELTFGCLVKIGSIQVGHYERGGEDIEENYYSEDVVIYINNLGNGFSFLYDENVFTTRNFGECPESVEIKEIIGEKATLTDFHKWMNENILVFKQAEKYIDIRVKMWGNIVIPYDSSKELLDQDESTLEQIRNLIISNTQGND